MTTPDGRHIRFGLANGSKKQSENFKSSDLIGIYPIVIGPEHLGKTLGVFVAVEVKTPDWNPAKKLDRHETAQFNFINWVVSRGGIAGFVNNVDSFLKIILK